jgi:hypothetical protein
MKKYLLFLLIMIIFLPILFNQGCKTAEEVYDIRGIWNLTFWVPTGSYGVTFKITFTGSETSGTATDTFPSGPGTGIYSVNNTQVTIIMTYTTGVTTYTGSFTTENDMSGTWIAPSETGIWDAHR